MLRRLRNSFRYRTWDWKDALFATIITLLILALVFIITMVVIEIVSPPKIEDGIVVGMQRKPESRIMVMMPIQSGDTTIMVPYWIYYPERWAVTIEGENTKGEIVQETFYVSEYDFNNIEVGQFISFKKIEATTEEPQSKVRA